MWTREVMGVEDQTESIPFLSIARSLGDYWSYVKHTGRYSVSPVPDLSVREIDSEKDHYLILITDGISNVLSSTAIAMLLDDLRGVRIFKFSDFINYPFFRMKAGTYHDICSRKQ